ncbi:dTDP-4-dehydrorhamnose reductase family protein [Pseudoalteromonas piratica]|uniref:dTDP-4-dehydrorhamnose reductase n=1 Tax=Pseudoalteromonas piratica TaxID=1348114 RepID=A0A0A7EKC9_9GAMM|nr:SDR family oxidoreductase [Pseudoalteromonas piratica]AIY67013.1 dTDP-4-dehydrorhamnose reductase [Pseudoalteromonas piratica]
MTKVLITGATGLLGRALFRVFSQQDFCVTGTGFSRAKAPIKQIDLTNKDNVTELLNTIEPDIIIHAAAERKPDMCENNKAHTKALNLAVTEHLAIEAKRLNARLFFISTDYVFDGTTPPYFEASTPNPLNFYGETKVLGEQCVLSVSANHTVIRVPVLYGDVETLSESAITTITEQVHTNPISKHDNWAVRYPTHVEDIAKTLVDLANLPSSETTGIFHVSDHQAYTKFQIATLTASLLNLDKSGVTPINEPSQSANRPHNCALKDTRLSALNIHHSRPFSEAFANIVKTHLDH